MRARAWIFGDDVDTDALAPGIYMKGGIEAMASHCLETLDADFAGSVRPGDVVVAGANFGMGSSREQAAQALRHLGVAAVVARSFGGIFYRNAFNNGLLALVCADAGSIAAGQHLDLDAEAGAITVAESGVRISCEPIPGHLMELVRLGGLVPYLEQRLERERGQRGTGAQDERSER